MSAAAPRDPMTSLGVRIRGPLIWAAVLALGFFVGIGVWSANAPLTSAAVAPGSIGLDARRKIIQHLEGGILAELHVSEGDQVTKGQLLLALDDTIAKSTLDLLQGQYIDMVALHARMTAERTGAQSVPMPQELLEIGSPDRVAQAMSAQRSLFDSRRQVYQSRVEILNAKIQKLQEQIKGFEVQQDALIRQMEILELESVDIEQMVNRGLERAPRLYALQREAARFDGVLGDLAARRSEAEVLIGETQLMLLELEAQLQNQLAGELSSLSGRIADMGPRLNAAMDRMARSQVRAPVAGTVVTLSRHTIGGVIGPGQPILEIVPSDLELLIEARVSPVEIDVVRPGLVAEVRLTAYAARSTPTIPGRVVHVSADRLTDQVSGFPYYAVHVRLDAHTDHLAPDIDLTQLYPGMPVEVMVVTGRRTVLDYLLQPINDILARTFRET